ncbi:hypothetical protein SDC9_194212 [bioreactor metagenome]|uniref:Uncharacterized protein n=1 Tax=bioreactor metagenome TaxID=1076179 RepID=A0A645I5N4_9ZZZZ
MGLAQQVSMMMSDVIKEFVFSVAERGLADSQLGSDLTFGEAVRDEAEDLPAIGQDAVQVLQQAGQHKLVHNAVFEGRLFIRDVYAKVAIF